jgi:hypothetical protein
MAWRSANDAMTYAADLLDAIDAEVADWASSHTSAPEAISNIARLLHPALEEDK